MVLIHKQRYKTCFNTNKIQGYLLQAASSLHYNSPTCWFTKYRYRLKHLWRNHRPEVQADQSPV